MQSLNPDVSAILDLTGGYGDRAPLLLSGDDPDLRNLKMTDKAAAGATVQEAEVALQSVVDPYFRADLFLTIPNLNGIEVEEAYVTTLSLPLDLQIKAGEFRSAFGRQNGQHLHLQDFTRRPYINAFYLGGDGLRAPGAQISWLVPVGFFLQLTAEAFSVVTSAADVMDLPVLYTTFGGGDRTDLTYTGEIKAFAPIGDSWSIYGGLSAATGVGMGAVVSPTRTELFGADLYVKYKPPNVSEGYFSLAWQSEWVYRRAELLNGMTNSDGGFYTQLVLQVARRWLLGVREDVVGAPSSMAQPLTSRTSGSITFVTSEFARVRAYAEHEIGPDMALGQSTGDRTAAYLQLEASIGAHGAHPF
jgi:hypothetical protein